MSAKPYVLIIDDDPFFRKTLEAALTRFNLAPIAVGTGDEFLNLLDQKNKPRLAIIDLVLGEGASGFDLIETVRRNHGTQIPIIVISGSDDEKSVAHALEVGANDFILKPLDRTLLASKLARFVDSTGISEFQSAFQELPEGRIPARLHLGCEIDEVDELGIKLLSKHLIPKGSVMDVSGEFLTTISPGTESCLVTVTSTWLEPNGLQYGAYAEFDQTDAALLQNIRRWLSGT